MNRKEYMRQLHLNRKIQAIRLVENGKCACRRCGIEDPVVLQFDHIVSTGESYNYRRQRNGTGRNNIYVLLYGKVSPEIYQVLCANCHVRKTVNERNGRNG